MKLKAIPAEKLIKAVAKLGFKEVRQRGGHVILKNEEGKVTVVPVHKGKLIGRDLLPAVIRDVGLKREEFLKLLAEF